MLKPQWTSIIAVLAVVACVLFGPTAFGQSEESSQQAKNSLRDGKSALNFEINGDFDLTSFEGATISFKHHYADNRAYRISISGMASSQDSESRTPVGGRSELDYDRYAISLFVQRLYYRSPRSTTTLFYGFGPRGGLNWQKTSTGGPSSLSRTESVSNGWDIGIVALVGFEWFVREEISLITQYASSLRYVSRSTESRTGTETNLSLTHATSDHSVQFDADVVRFGVSLYW